MLRLLAMATLLTQMGPFFAESDSDFSRLQGTWRVISWESSGVFHSEDEVNSLKVVAFNGYHYRWEGDSLVGTFRLDSRTDPKSVDYTMGGFPFAGIYQIEGDHFRDCIAAPGAERPTDFGTEEGDGVNCVEYVRADPGSS